jgi:uncharacterized OB-fold protein
VPIASQATLPVRSPEGRGLMSEVMGEVMGEETPVMPFADLAEDAPVTGTGPDGAAVLIAARCSGCGSAWFPMRPVCPYCSASSPEPFPVGPGGTLYSYTTVHISSARPTPYVLGYVDLDQGVRVLATIEAAPEWLELDRQCRLQVGDDGQWWFTLEEP